MNGQRTGPLAGERLSDNVTAAKRQAPDHATDMEILAVGWYAWQERRDVVDVWQEVEA